MPGAPGRGRGAGRRATPATFSGWPCRSRARSRQARYVRAGAGGGAVAGWVICAPHEHASQTYPFSKSPSNSPQRWCSATKNTKAARLSGMGPEGTTTGMSRLLTAASYLLGK